MNAILFANAIHSTGLGHLIRSLNFIRYYFEGAHVIIIGEISSPKILTRFNDMTFELMESPISRFSRSYLTEILSHVRVQSIIPQLILVDNPIIDFDIELELKSLSAQTVTFLDYPHRETHADFVISTNALETGVESTFRKIMKNQQAKLFVGPEFFVLDRSFYSESITNGFKSNRVAANFGASDPGNYMKRLLEIVSQDYFRKFNFDLVLGPMSNTKISKSFSWPEHIKVSEEYEKSYDFWSSCEIAIGSVGISFLERMFLGIPTLVVPQTPEQLAEAQRFEELGQGLVLKHFFSENLRVASEEILEFLLDREKIEHIRVRLIDYQAIHLSAIEDLGKDILGH